MGCSLVTNYISYEFVSHNIADPADPWHVMLFDFFPHFLSVLHSACVQSYKAQCRCQKGLFSSLVSSAACLCHYVTQHHLQPVDHPPQLNPYASTSLSAVVMQRYGRDKQTTPVSLCCLSRTNSEVFIYSQGCGITVFRVKMPPKQLGN